MTLCKRRRAHDRAIFEHYVEASSCPFGTRGRDPGSNMMFIRRHQIIKLGHQHGIVDSNRDSLDPQL
jgi:hypothetical protein